MVAQVAAEVAQVAAAEVVEVEVEVEVEVAAVKAVEAAWARDPVRGGPCLATPPSLATARPPPRSP